MGLYKGNNLVTPVQIVKQGGGSSDEVTAINKSKNAVLKDERIFMKRVNSEYHIVNIEKEQYNNIYSPTYDYGIDNGIIKIFPSDGLRIPLSFKPGSNPWEMKFKIKTGNALANRKIIHACINNSSSNKRYGVGLNIYNSKFGLFVSSNGSSWMFDETGTYNPLTNTIYWIKIGWDETKYYLKYSLDGINYVEDITYSSVTPVYNDLNDINLCCYHNNSFEDIWNGEIYLDDCDISINGVSIWNPKTPYVYTNNVIDYLIKTDMNGFAKFSNTSYIQATHPSGSFNTFEIGVKFKYECGYSTTCAIFGNTPGEYAPCLKLYNGKLTVRLPYNNDWVSTTELDYTLSEHGWYYIKMIYSSNNVKVYISNDGVSYELIGNINISAIDFNQDLYFGAGDAVRFMNGIISLKDTYIKVDNLYIWDPKVLSVIDIDSNTLQGKAKENILINGSGKVYTVL